MSGQVVVDENQISGVQQSPANVIDSTNNAVRVNVVAGGGGGGGPATIADGADVAEGSTTDIAITSDANGTISGKLRGLVKILASVWDSVNGRLKVDGSGVTQPVSGTVAVTNLDVALSTRTKPSDQQHAIIDSGTTVVTQGTGTNLHVVVDAAPTTSVTQGTSPWVTSGTSTVSGTVTGNQGSPNTLPNAWPIEITDGTNTPNILQLNTQPTDSEFGLTTVSVIHGHTTAGGSAYVDVKVNPSGTLATQDNSDATLGTTSAPSTGTLVMGKSADGTPTYSPLPLAAGSASVVVSGTVTANQGGAPWSVSGSGNFNVTGATTPVDSSPLPTNAIPAQAFPMLYNGSTFDMLRGDKNNGLQVQLSDLWILIDITRKMYQEMRALRLVFSTVSGQFVEDDDIDTQIQ